MKKIPVIAVVGPTASGKTSLSIEIAKHFGGQVVSADSMQIYEKMNIATAKPTLDEMQGIPHHLIGFVNPDEPFSVAKYCEMAKDVIFDLNSRNKKAVLVGGTGLYFNSLVDNIQFFDEETDFEYREFLKKEAEEKEKREKAEAEEKARLEKENNPSTEELLKQILSVLKEK